MNRDKIKRELLKEFLNYYPISLALIRTLEIIEIIQDKENLTPPILDLGCGDGIVFKILQNFIKYEKKALSIGLDLDYKTLKKAEKINVHNYLIQSNSKKMPFRNNFFNSIIANSVIEHIREVDDTLFELNRVLKRGGILFLTFPSENLSELFFFSNLFKRIKLIKIGKGYAKLKNKLWKHINLFEIEIWESKLIKSGFKVLKRKNILNQHITYMADILFPASFFYYVNNRFLNRGILFKSKLKTNFLVKLLLKFSDKSSKKYAGYYLKCEKVKELF